LGRPRRAIVNRLKQRMLRLWRKPPFDLNIMLEHVWPEHAALARCNIALPNAEWFDDKDCRQLAMIDQVWAKTRQTETIFRALGKHTVWTGFDTRWPANRTQAPSRDFFHLAGGSRTKGTQRLLTLWARHPEWPVLTVVGRLQQPMPEVTNIKLIEHYLDYDALLRLQCEHRFHLCPSEAEGYGHYLVEAMALGALPITTDAAPMNELVDATRGLLVAAEPAGRMGLVTLQLFDEAAMEQAVAQALTMPAERFSSGVKQARAWAWANHQTFVPRIGAALAQLTQARC
jgi:glycosyltransferase involved in cell wall biosynthesis